MNLRSAKVQNETKKVVRHWLDNGVSGFRLLSVPYLYESENTTLDEPPIAGLTDNSYAALDHIYTTNLVEDYNFVGEIRAILQEYEDIDGDHRVLFVEAEDTKGEMAMKYYGDEEKPLADISVNSNFVRQNVFTGTNLKDQIVDYLSQVDKVKGWPNWLLGNADTERLASRLDDKLIEAISMVQLLLPGTPVTYYGDEIGMKDVLLPGQSGSPCPTGNQLTAQSHCNQVRSPYQWDSTPETAGFTKAKPWYPVGDNVDTVNAKTQMETQLSFFNVYRELVNLRTKAAIMYGTFSILNVTTDDIFAFTR